jgi:PIN domain nuclease of toxin-antitoxin system
MARPPAVNVLLDTCALLARTACAAAALPLIHREPFDRVLVVLAQQRELTVLTSDENIPKYDGVQTVWSSHRTCRGGGV